LAFEKIARAHQIVESGQAGGKLVVKGAYWHKMADGKGTVTPGRRRWTMTRPAETM
jgi:hypothetical protein